MGDRLACPSFVDIRTAEKWADLRSEHAVQPRHYYSVVEDPKPQDRVSYLNLFFGKVAGWSMRGTVAVYDWPEESNELGEISP